MKIAVCCGGTGGHIFPGLAVAGELKARGHDVVLWLAGRNVEVSAVANWTGEVVTVQSRGFSGGVLSSAAAAFSMVRSVLYCRHRMKRMKPAVLLAMGSYASVGPVLAARSLGVRVVLHEANAVPGRAISMLSRYADTVAVSHAVTCRYLSGRKCVCTGFPVRKDILGVVGRQGSADVFSILVLGGSLGAHAVNEVVSRGLCEAHSKGLKFKVIHLTGTRDEVEVRSRYEKAGVPHEVHGFLKDMARAYAGVDFAICRAGGATCAELSAVGLPALLVPLPGAPRDHQMANALAMKEQGSADVMEQGALTADWLASYLTATVQNHQKLERMRSASASSHGTNATATLADLVVEAGRTAVCRP